MSNSIEGLKDGAYFQQKLSPKEIEGVRKLEENGAKKGIGYKIDPGLSTGIIYIENGEIKGFMTFDCFGGEDIESAAIANSKEAWEAMSAELLERSRERARGGTGEKRILYICSPADKLVSGILKEKGMEILFTEYRMNFNAEGFSSEKCQGVSLRAASNEDLPYIHFLEEGAGWGDAPDEPMAGTSIILHNGENAGKLRVNGDDGCYGIYGVIIDKELRGRGIGGKALMLTINKLIETGAESIYLEVDSENPVAFNLYKKLGFEVSSEFSYYPFNL